MSELRTREQIPASDRWDLTPMYASGEVWEEAFKRAQGLPASLAAWRGRLGEGPETLAAAMAAMFEAFREIEKLYVYAHLRHDENLEESEHHARFDRARKLYYQLDEAVSFFDPELLQLDQELLKEWLLRPDVGEYRVYLEEVMRHKPHTLSPAEERLLAMAGEALGTSEQVFGMLNNLDIPGYFVKVEDENGEEVQLTHGVYQKLIESPKREVRRQAFHRYFEVFGKHKHALAAALDGQVKAHIFEARARNHTSAREAALFSDQVSVEVYDSLIDAMHSRAADMDRYMALRKQALGLDILHVYDVYTPIVPDIDLTYTWDEAEALVLDAVKPLGDAYVSMMRKGLASGWVDRYENKGKRSGAYSSGCYDSMPYILHNFNGTLHAVFTLAHELGHSMHTALSNAHQPYHSSHYRIFVAEVASTTNEALLLHHLLEQTKDRKLRAYLVNHYLNDFRTTMFRQTMFAEFERDIHAFAEKGQALTPELLDEHYQKLVRSYFGEHFAWDEEDAPIAWEWSRIPHFYYNFYVYKYATGMAAATSLVRGILHDGAPALSRYLDFLKAGCSQPPLQLLRNAGVDLTTPAPVETALDTFRDLLDQLETLLD